MSGKVSDDVGVYLGSAGLFVLGVALVVWIHDHTLAAVIAGIIGMSFLIGGGVKISRSLR